MKDFNEIDRWNRREKPRKRVKSNRKLEIPNRFQRHEEVSVQVKPEAAHRRLLRTLKEVEEAAKKYPLASSERKKYQEFLHALLSRVEEACDSIS